MENKMLRMQVENLESKIAWAYKVSLYHNEAVPWFIRYKNELRELRAKHNHIAITYNPQG